MQERTFSYKDIQKAAVPFRHGNMYKFMYAGSRRKRKRKVKGK